MKFDPVRALEEAKRFAGERLPWTEPGRRAAETWAEALAALGCDVETHEVSGSPTARNLRLAGGWLGFGAGLTVAYMLTLAGGYPWIERLAIVAASFGWLLVAGPWLLLSFDPRTWRPIPARNVVATRTSSTAAPVRVVFLTSLDASPALPLTRGRKASGYFFLLMVLSVVALSLAGMAIPRPAGLVILAQFEAALIVWVVCRVRPFVGEGPTTNADGLGSLIELARTWPSRHDARIEVRFVALGGQTLDAAGLRPFSIQALLTWPEKPVLFIGFWSPAYGQRVALVASKLGEFARKAAAELWIPYRFVAGPTVYSDVLPPMDEDEFGAVALLGDGHSGPDPAALARAAQLAVEIALRWSKLAAESRSPDY